MIKRLLTSLLAPVPAPLPAPEARLALAALLVRLARADGRYDDEETRRIDLVIATRYGLSPFEAAAVRREAEEIEAEAPDTVRFTRALKDAVPHEERMGIMTALWRVALADGERDAEEDALIRLVANLLGISDRDSAIARQRVESQE
ncbi:TerB family tellurite resistance protein [Ostreiculturibacter nitratireducens]|uniref:tellurite resistance TerB family protein n=1 Tax=Ostreiculturibacter nitratireducens TaxID=3075226 RepID=UPI0031B56BB1